MALALSPTVFSPATPSQLLSYVLNFETYPTTILICSPREDFVAALVEEVHREHASDTTPLAQVPPEGEGPLPAAYHFLLRSPLFQVARSRHLRVLFIPTVSHLRAWLSVFDSEGSKILPQPDAPSRTSKRPPLLLIYGLLDLHRDTSEWSAQGISNTTATLVEAARLEDFKPVVVEPQGSGNHEAFESLLDELLPILRGTRRKENGEWAGRTVAVRAVLGRWFRFQGGPWNES